MGKGDDASGYCMGGGETANRFLAALFVGPTNVDSGREDLLGQQI
jgi:hypothetical protein